MKKLMMFIITLSMLMTISSVSYARNTKNLLPINVAMNSAAGTEKLDNSVKFFFGDQAHPKILKDFGTYYVNRKTNAFGKSDDKACNWVFLSAMRELQARAKKLGANAVVNIVSYYKKNEMSSTDQFECHAGGFVAGVALKGDFVRIDD
jgi:hypothetical protein